MPSPLPCCLPARPSLFAFTLLLLGAAAPAWALAPGDIAIVGRTNNTTPDALVFATLAELPVGTQLYFTDNGWTGTAFRGASATDGDGNENLLRFTALQSIPAGTLIASTDASSPAFTWTTGGAIPGTSSGAFLPLQLATAGDQIAAFTGPDNNPLAAPGLHLFVLDDTGTFEPATSSNTGAIPPGLAAGTTAVTVGLSATGTIAVNAAALAGSHDRAGWLTILADPAQWGAAPSLPSGALIVTDGGGADVVVTVTALDGAATEAGADTAVFRFTRTGAPAGALDIALDGDDGTATAGGDFTPVVPATITFPAGVATLDLVFTPVDDTDPEGPETLVLRVLPGDGYAVGGTGQAGAVLADDDAPPGTLRRIHEVQGAGTVSPLAGQQVTVEAVVTGFVTGPSGREGFYLQEEDADADAAATTSEGVYVYAPAVPATATVALGDRVRVTGTVSEFFELTELTDVSALAVLDPAVALPAAATPVLPVATPAALEPFEGMRVRFSQTLTVTETRLLGQYGELLLAAAGRRWQPTHLVDPNDDPAIGTTTSGTSNVAAVTAFAQANLPRTLVLDDASTRTYPDPTPHLSGNGSAATRRVGDTVTGLTGVLGYRFGAYRLDPQEAIAWTVANPRPAAPPDVGPNALRLASANVLNYFLTLAGAGGRGATTTAELARQRAKTIAALVALAPDVCGLMEIERRADNAVLADLVAGLNAATAPGTYAFIDSAAIAGTDAIQVALLYRPAVVTPVGPPRTDTSAGASIHNRPPLAQAFEEVATGGRFTVVVNHFKSKSPGGASGADLDQGDGQGAFNARRRQQAAQLLAFVADPAATFGDPDVLILGDLNAYAEEDPIDVLRAGGFSDQIARFHGTAGYSYVFDGQSGYLDHALANAGFAAQVTDAAEWHINADEPTYLDYNLENKSAAQEALNAGTPFRSSDHDPVLVGFVPGGGRYAAWSAAMGLPPALQAPTDDADADGLRNLAEFALGLSPLDGAGAGDAIVLESGAAGGTLRYTVSRRALGVTVVVEVSPDLATWTPLATTPVRESSTPVAVTWAVPLPVSPSGRQFARLLITSAP